MATNYHFQCPTCGKGHWPGGLHEVFARWTREGGAWTCEECDAPYHFYLTFPFAFGADGRVRMVDIFKPKTSCVWTDPGTGHRIEYHPYLAIGETLDATPKLTAWLPYWHSDEHGGRTKMKFGQWAPHMDLQLFAELVDQAREKKHLV